MREVSLFKIRMLIKSPRPVTFSPRVRMSTHSSLFIFLVTLSFIAQSSTALHLTTYKTLISLSHSLLSRVANARESRGDLAGAARAREIAGKLRLLGGGREIWAVGWDFAWNYAIRGGLPTAEIYRAGADLLEALMEFSGLDSGAERANWVIRNYERVVGLSDSLFQSLLRVFSKSGPLREAILMLQKEVMDGKLLKDCMEVGARDLEGLIRIAKDLLFYMDSNDSEL